MEKKSSCVSSVSFDPSRSLDHNTTLEGCTLPSTCPSPHSLCLPLSLSSSPSTLPPDTQASFTSASVALLIDLHWPYSKGKHCETHSASHTKSHAHRYSQLHKNAWLHVFLLFLFTYKFCLIYLSINSI